MRFKRLVASVTAGFDDFVSKVENHEAVADCMIDEVRQATAGVRVQQARVAAQVSRFEKQRDELAQDERRWNARALELAERDEDKALECVRRARRAAERCAAIEAQLTAHRRLADDLSARLADLEGRLNEIRLKRTALSSRAARARTVRSARRADCESVDAVFDRWETVVVADEYLEDVGVEGPDPLDREFRDEEERAELKARLEVLKGQGGES